MYVAVVQKVSVPLEVLVSLFDSCKNLAPIKLLHFFLRTLLLPTILLCIKANTFDMHIFWEIDTDLITYPIDPCWRLRSTPMLSHILCR